MHTTERENGPKSSGHKGRETEENQSYETARKPPNGNTKFMPVITLNVNELKHSCQKTQRSWIKQKPQTQLYTSDKKDSSLRVEEKKVLFK